MLDNLGQNVFGFLQVLAAIGSIITAVGLLGDWLRNRRKKQLNYRVHWNGPMTHAAGQPFDPKLEVSYAGTAVTLPEIAVIRVANTGADLKASDFHHRVLIRFPGRVIQTATAASEPEDLATDFGDFSGWGRPDASSFLVPAVALEHNDKYRLSVLLDGPPGEVEASWTGGKLVPEKARVRPRRTALALGGATLALLGLSAGLYLVPDRPTAPTVMAVTCHSGTMTVDGSTAVRPALTRLAAVFAARCRAAHPDADPQIVVNESSSGEALRELITLGQRSTDQVVRRTRMVMYDGAAADPDQVLARHTLGIGVFGLVAHEGAIPDRGLSVGQIRTLWNGQASTFSVVGGSGQRVRLVSRQDGSGTRAAFERQVLAGTTKAKVTSSNCADQDPGQTADYVHCVQMTTESVLSTVDSLDGAIGYADVHLARNYRHVQVLNINGHGPGEQDIAAEAYRFWAVENLYTFGEPPEGTVLKDFLTFVAGDGARGLLTKEFGYLPCSRFSNDEAAKACASK
ncbi:PstS family phosphate ABC transporter substrate-binding protein [Cryptosporangium phraense]|uniref:PstS family phosphate ABC transporter substrate-binding protein n=1 Tax=Cryptosporangium phraense TaxID=2593070 RepID=UPI0014796CF3|nr:substrate-binding domain-containing protein [Cryptosporangium phraense]